MKICNNCKQEIKDNQMFCGNCGTKIETNINSDVQMNSKSANTNNQTNPNNNKQKKRKKHRFLKFLIFLVIVIILFKGITAYKSTLNKIYITNKDIIETKDNANFYKLDKKIEKIKLKIKTFKKVKNTTIKLSSNNLVLFEEQYEANKNWQIEDISLPIGVSELYIKVTLENNKIIERKITLCNTTEDNLGKLDTKDSDNDKLLNYQEEIYNTNKLSGDTDQDGLTDYEEITYTNTNPIKYATFTDDLSDANDDYDKDGLSNLEELQLGTNVLLSDTDGDGLTDYEEIKVYQTNYKTQDTDNDNVTDYNEVKNFSTDPLSKTERFSGKVESENKEVGITLDNITISDIKNTKFEHSGLAVLSEKVSGYIMPAYDISTNVPFASSELAFNFAGYKISENAIPTIYYFNDKTEALEELPTTITGTIAKTTVTHFSTYILIDKNEYNNVNKIDSNAGTTEIIKPITGEYIFFVSPLLAKLTNQPLEIMASPDITDEEANQVKEEIRLSLESDYQVNINIIKSKTGFDFLKKFYNIVYEALYTFMVDLELQDLFTTHNISDNSYYHNLANCILIGYLQNTKDLGSFVTGEDQINIFEDNKVLIDLDDKTDTNKDGISDNYTIAILNGNIKTSTGINPLEGYTLDEIQKNDDLDKDGIKNGKEIKIAKNEEGKLYIEMTSNPTLKDSDLDGLQDKEDKEPLKSDNPGFIVGGKLSDNIKTNGLEQEVKKYNSLFGTGEIVYEQGNFFNIKYQENGKTKYSPNTGSNIVGELGSDAMSLAATVSSFTNGAWDANNALHRYFTKSSNTYTEKDLIEPSLDENGNINKNSIFGSTDTQNYLKINAQKIIDISENIVKSGETKVLTTTQPLTGTSPKDGFDQNLNVFGFLHSSSAHMIAEVQNKNDNYTMKLRYFIVDIYDWKNAEECDIKNAGCSIEVDYYNDMLLGNAKAFLVKIEYDMELNWEKGKPPKMKLLDGTPFA